MCLMPIICTKSRGGRVIRRHALSSRGPSRALWRAQERRVLRWNSFHTRAVLKGRAAAQHREKSLGFELSDVFGIIMMQNDPTIAPLKLCSGRFLGSMAANGRDRQYIVYRGRGFCTGTPTVLVGTETLPLTFPSPRQQASSSKGQTESRVCLPNERAHVKRALRRT